MRYLTSGFFAGMCHFFFLFLMTVVSMTAVIALGFIGFDWPDVVVVDVWMASAIPCIFAGGAMTLLAVIAWYVADVLEMREMDRKIHTSAIEHFHAGTQCICDSVARHIGDKDEGPTDRIGRPLPGHPGYETALQACLAIRAKRSAVEPVGSPYDDLAYAWSC